VAHAAEERDLVALEGHPGAGKTTLVPPALLDAAWLGGRTIVMLQAGKLLNAKERIALLDTTGSAVPAGAGAGKRAKKS